MNLGARIRATLRCLACCALAVVVASCGDRTADGGGDVYAVRSLAPRLSLPVRYQRCTARQSPGGTIPLTLCPPGEGDRARAQRLLRESRRAGADSLHSVALLDLLWPDSAGNSLQRSISLLETAARLAERPAPRLADLAAAHLARAERTQNPRELLEALEAAEEAAALEPRNTEALFNRALALDRLHLAGQAASAWRAYLAVDSTSGWAREAAARVAWLRTLARGAEPPAPPPGAPDSAMASYAVRAPQAARLHGLEEVLGEWGRAELEGDAARAPERLRTAEVLGRTLERSDHDATLADAVRAIRAARGDGRLRRRLAEAHAAYGEGRRLYLAGENPAAGRQFERVMALRVPSPALTHSAELFHAATLVYHGRLDDAEHRLRDLIAAADTARCPTLAGGAYWALATTLLRGGRYEAGLDAARAGERHFARTGEREHLGGIQGLAANVEFRVGATAAGYASTHRSLATLEPMRGSVWLHNELANTAAAAALDGYRRAALRFHDEDVAVSARIGRTQYLAEAEARLSRAALLAAVGRAHDAQADIEAGRALIAGLPDGEMRASYNVEGWIAQAAVARVRDPARAEAALDSVLQGSPANPLRVLQALIARADARLARGKPDGTLQDLDRATTLLAEQRAEIASSPLRAALVDGAASVFDRVTMLRVHARDGAGALAYLERGRMSFSPFRAAAAAAEPTGWRPLAGEVALDYALVGDTLLTWAADGAGLHLVRRTIDRGQLTRTIEHARSMLQYGADEADARRVMAILYDWLLRPVQGWLGPSGGRIVVVADGDIAAVPFAALFDSVRGVYLVEDHAIRYAGSLSDAARQGDRAAGSGGALFVADPAFDPHSFPGLQRLPGAAAEVAEASAVWPSPVVLDGDTATRPALESALRQAAVMHFAGHALFDDERPERSALVLAPTAQEQGRITAAELERMDLRHVRLLVLSACQTLRSRSGRAGGFAGFTDAALTAGAGGVVGGAWEVDDALTRPLMTAFHQEYRRSGDGAAALRAAQLRLLRSDDAALRSPTAWAAFRYAGG